MRRSPCAFYLLGAWMSVAAWLLTACSQEVGYGGESVFHCHAFDIYPDSVDMHTGMILRAYGDSVIQVRVEGNTLRTVSAGKMPRSRWTFRFWSDYPLFDALMRLEASRVPDGSYTPLSPYELYLNPFTGAEGERLLESRIRNGYLIPSDTRRYVWPVINENPQWILAACELFKITADRFFLEKTGTVAANIAAEERKVCYGQLTGLIGGIPRYMATSQDMFPEWIGPGELHQTATFGVNAAWWGALRSMADITVGMALRNEMARLPEMTLDPDSLRNSIFRYFWNPEKGRFSAMLYGDPLRPMALGASDNLAQGMAVLTGLPLHEMSEMIIGKTPAAVTGISLFDPVLASGGVKKSAVEALAQVVWAIAASRAGNDKAYNAAVAATLYNLCDDILGSRHNSPAVMRQPLTSLVLRGFCGITTAFEGLYFAPSVPSVMSGTMRITGLKYRRSELSVTIAGTGNKVASFMIDGKEAEPFLPASEEGHHDIAITLASEAPEQADADFSASGSIGRMPAVEWTSPADVSFIYSGNDSGKRDIWAYVDGLPVEEAEGRHYTLDDTSAVRTVQFCATPDGNWPGFATAPVLYVPQGFSRTIDLTDVARGGSGIFQDRTLASRFVESTRYRNRKIAFDVTVEEKGVYAVAVHYANGLGIVNSRRRTALRSLSVDGVPQQGVFVFTQLSPVDWDNDPAREWQMMTGFTNPLMVSLDPGTHTFELRYYQPTPVYIDPFSNTVVADYVRLIRYK